MERFRIARFELCDSKVALSIDRVGFRMAILNRFSAILLHCDSASLRFGSCLCFSLRNFWRFLLVKVARLQSELCTKDFFLSYEFSYEKCPDIFPEIFEPSFCGSEKILQNSRQISHQISLRKIIKNSPTSFCRSAGRTSGNRAIRDSVPLRPGGAPKKIVKKKKQRFWMADLLMKRVTL